MTPTKKKEKKKRRSSHHQPDLAVGSREVAAVLSSHVGVGPGTPELERDRVRWHRTLQRGREEGWDRWPVQPYVPKRVGRERGGDVSDIDTVRALEAHATGVPAPARATVSQIRETAYHITQ